jgi:predicted O-linked N-acetylglucosamine transferase (SPINDLY family)
LKFLIAAAELKPESASAQRTLARELVRIRQFDQAIERFRQATALEPSNSDLTAELFAALEKAQRFAEAEGLAQELLNTGNHLVASHLALGRALARRRCLSQAAEAFQRAFELDPVSAANPLAAMLGRLGRLEEGLAIFRRTISNNPAAVVAHSNLVFDMAFSPHYDAAQIFEQARHWNTIHAVPLLPKRQAHPHDRTPDRKLRIAYVSPDFYGHVQRLFTVPIFGCHDRSQFQTVCYASVAQTDRWTHDLKSLVDEWHDVSHLDDGELAQKVRDDRIDLLVDLTMHMAGSRLRVFAEKPAPVQISWLAYPGTTGVDGIDYRITDPFLDPPSTSLPYCEQSLWLPNSFWCYGPSHDEGTVGASPHASNGFVTFGCLNNFKKVNQNVLALWAKVLQAVPQSHLLLLAPEGSPRKWVLEVLEGLNVSTSRVGFVDLQSRSDYLATYNRIDIALDTFPYGGHTTSLDAYWMGVPVVTLVGNTIVGRAGLSLASNLGLIDWVAHSSDQFVAIATQFARAPQHLAQLRSVLRQKLLASPLMDAATFTRDLEGLYRSAWRRWCASH